MARGPVSQSDTTGIVFKITYTGQPPKDRDPHRRQTHHQQCERRDQQPNLFYRNYCKLRGTEVPSPEPVFDLGLET